MVGAICSRKAVVDDDNPNSTPFHNQLRDYSISYFSLSSLVRHSKVVRTLANMFLWKFVFGMFGRFGLEFLSASVSKIQIIFHFRRCGFHVD